MRNQQSPKFKPHKKITRIQKCDRKMKHRKRDTASCVSSNRSNIARAMRVRMPKRPPNLVPPENSIQPEASSGKQITESEVIFAPTPTNQVTELMLPFTSALLEALHQVLSRSTKKTRKSPKYYGFENDNSSGESTNSCLPNFAPPRRKRRTDYFESVQPSVIQIIVDTAAQV